MMVAIGEGCKGMSNIGEGEWEVQASRYGLNGDGDERHSMGNTPNDTVTAMCDDRWRLHLW